jgi:amino acid transporter
MYYMHRRNNTIAGLTQLLGAILIAAGAFTPWATITGPNLGISLGGKSTSLGFDVIPNMDSSGDSDSKAVLAVLAGVIAVLALALIATRVRGLGMLWRLGSLVALIVPAVLTVYLWKLVTGDPAEIFHDPNASAADKIRGVLQAGFERLGLIHVDPGLGLWLLSIGSVLVFLGIWIPATRTKEPRDNPSPYSHPGRYYPQPRSE